MKNNDISDQNQGSKRSTLTFEEIMEVLQEELANCEIADEEFSPLNFDEINGK